MDGSSIIFRSFYGVPQTNRSPDGKLINALRGFLDTLARRIDERKPRHVAVTTDEDWRPDWRVELIPSYKAHRTAEPVPHALEPQIPVIMDGLDAVGVDVVGLDDYEAEDIIASLVTKVEPPIEILSGDRDLFSQIRDREIVVLYPEKTGLTVVDEAEVARRYGIPGRSYSDYAILRGESATRRRRTSCADTARSRGCWTPTSFAPPTLNILKERSEWCRLCAISRSRFRAAGASATRSIPGRSRSSGPGTELAARSSA